MADGHQATRRINGPCRQGEGHTPAVRRSGGGYDATLAALRGGPWLAGVIEPATPHVYCWRRYQPGPRCSANHVTEPGVPRQLVRELYSLRAQRVIPKKRYARSRRALCSASPCLVIAPQGIPSVYSRNVALWWRYTGALNVTDTPH